MFRKYTVLTAAMLLATTVSVASAEYAAAVPHGACSANQACNPTCGDRNATCVWSFPTDGYACATSWSCDTTCDLVIGEYPICDPTAIPQPTPTLPPAQKPSATQSPSPGDDYTTQSITAQEQKMANLLNADRQTAGLAPLILDAELCRIARIKSADMRDNVYFAHESPTYGRVGDMLRRFGYGFAAAGENIAHHASVDKAQAAFMSSAGHRANILSTAWAKVGIGIVTDPNGFIYATQIFVK